MEGLIDVDHFMYIEEVIRTKPAKATSAESRKRQHMENRKQKHMEGFCKPIFGLNTKERERERQSSWNSFNIWSTICYNNIALLRVYEKNMKERYMS